MEGIHVTGLESAQKKAFLKIPNSRKEHAEITRLYIAAGGDLSKLIVSLKERIRSKLTDKLQASRAETARIQAQLGDGDGDPGAGRRQASAFAEDASAAAGERCEG